MSYRAGVCFLGAVVAASFFHCSSFHSNDDTLPDDAEAPAADATAPDDAPLDVPAADAAEAEARTGVACGLSDMTCPIGQKCCAAAQADTFACAAACGDVDGGVYIFECGKTSDCAANQECCFHHGFGCDTGVDGSRCVAQDNCVLCAADGGGGPGELGCDVARSDECPAGQTCTQTLFAHYEGCSQD